MGKNLKRKIKKKVRKKVSRNKLNKNLEQVAAILSQVSNFAGKTNQKHEHSEESFNSSSDSPTSSATQSLSASSSSKESEVARVSGWKMFVKVRERSFTSLQSTIRDNWNQNSSVKLTSSEVLDLSLMVEQNALLASMQSRIYQKTISEIISKIQESSTSKKLHPQLERFIRSIWERHKGLQIKSERCSTTNKRCQTSKSPKKPVVNSSTAVDHVTSEPCSIKPVNSCQPDLQTSCQAGNPIPVIVTAACTPISVAYDASDDYQGVSSPFNFVETPYNEFTSLHPSHENYNAFEHSAFVSNPSPEPSNYGNVTVDTDKYFVNTPMEPTESEGVTSTTGVKNNYPDDIDNLMRILQGEDGPVTPVENQFDLDTRVEQMGGLFNVVSHEPNVLVSDETRLENVKRNMEIGKMFCDDLSGKRSAQLWAIERYIFMFRIIAETARMDGRAYGKIRDNFHSLFGPDSDNENEDYFGDYEKFTKNCVRRVCPTVARYLNPYYKQSRICQDTVVFKNLVRRISVSLIDYNYYPNDREIKDYVVKFFPHGQKFLNVGDVWSFVLDSF